MQPSKVLINYRQKKTISIFFLHFFHDFRSSSNFKTVGDTEGYSFLMPVLKALLEKSRVILNLTVHAPDLPPTASGPVFFNDFQMYITTKQWCSFIEKKVRKNKLFIQYFVFLFFFLWFFLLFKNKLLHLN